MTLEKAKSHFVLTIWLIFVILILALAYFSYIDGKFIRKPITYNSDPLLLKTDKEVYQRGEEVKVWIDYCKHRNITAHIQWTLIDHIVVFFPPKDSSVAKGCGAVWLTIGKIPKLIEPGTDLHFDGLIQYQVNPFSVVTVPLKSQNFTLK